MTAALRKPYPFPDCSRCYARPVHCNGRVAPNASGGCPLYIAPCSPEEWRDKGIEKIGEEPPF
jgi:hypothetical protein